MNGLTSAASGMLSDERLQQLVMNNIANISTPGYKSSSGALMAFPEMLMQSYNYLSGGGTTSGIGTVNNGVMFQEASADFAQGGITQTGQPFDLAIQDPLSKGSYVYALNNAGKAVLTNTLSIVVGKGGVLETGNGQPILPIGSDSRPITQARIVANSKYKGVDLIGGNGSPIYDANGQPSFQIQATGKTASLTGAHAYVADASSSGLHALFAVENIDAAGKAEVALTRDGHFQVGSNNFLYNALGQRVLAVGANGQPILNSAILINPNFQGKTYFGADGAPVRDAKGQLSYSVVQANGQPLTGASANATFGTTDVNVNSLQPLGATDYLPTATTAYTASQAGLHEGALESGNVNSTQAMTDMLSIYENYQANQKVIQAVSQTLQSATTQVGQVQGI